MTPTKKGSHAQGVGRVPLTEETGEAQSYDCVVCVQLRLLEKETVREEWTQRFQALEAEITANGRRNCSPRCDRSSSAGCCKYRKQAETEAGRKAHEQFKQQGGAAGAA